MYTFTPRLGYLIDMLQYGIKPRYIYELIPIPNKNWYYIVAAKCFCDIPLGMIKSHLNWFGNYGLGINKQYLQKQGASPVIYIHWKSNWIIDTLIKNGIKELKKYPTLPFLKRYSGSDYKKQDDGTYTRHFRTFYDEREWRFIPLQNNLSVGKEIKQIRERFNLVSTKNVQEENNISEINISPKDIEYLIINKSDEFAELRKRLRDIYSRDDDYELMLSKILIAERILRDF